MHTSDFVGLSLIDVSDREIKIDLKEIAGAIRLVQELTGGGKLTPLEILLGDI